jgi:hypothetical protein
MARANDVTTIGDVVDELHRHVRRCQALSASVIGMGEAVGVKQDPYFNGVDQLSNDLWIEAQQILEALEAIVADKPDDAQPNAES